MTRNEERNEETPAPAAIARDAWLALGTGIPLLAVASAMRRIHEATGIAAYAIGSIAIVFGVVRLFSARARQKEPR